MFANQDKRNVQIGDVYTMRFNGTGSVQSGLRPAVILQNNVGNIYSPNVIVLPMTSQIKKAEQITHVVVYAKDTGLQRDSMVLCENPECVPKCALERYICTLPDGYMAKIAEAHTLATSAISFVRPESLMILWAKAMELNSVKTHSPTYP